MNPNPLDMSGSGVPEVEQGDFEQEVARHGQRLAAEAAPVAPVEERTEEDDDVQAALVTLRAYLEDLQDGFLQSEASAIFEALGKVEASVRRGEQR